jgi:hypothetical protein
MSSFDLYCVGKIQPKIKKSVPIALNSEKMI